MLWKCCTQYVSKFGKLTMATRLEKVSFHSNPKNGNVKEYSNYQTTAFISHASKLMPKIPQASLQQYVNQDLLDVQAGFRKGRETRDQIANIRWIIEKAREYQKKIYFCCVETMLKPLTVWTTTNCGKFLRRCEYQTTLSASWKTYIQVKKQQLELDMEHGPVQNWERSMSRLHIVTLLIWLKCRVHNAKCQAGWITSWNQDCWDKYQQPQIYRWYHPNGRVKKLA